MPTRLMQCKWSLAIGLFVLRNAKVNSPCRVVTQHGEYSYSAHTTLRLKLKPQRFAYKFDIWANPTPSHTVYLSSTDYYPRDSGAGTQMPFDLRYKLSRSNVCPAS